MEEGNIPYPRYHKCDMFVAHEALSGRNFATSKGRRVEERKRHRLAEKEVRAGTDMDITEYGIPLSPVTSFN